jgi:hypothetical protein
MSQNLVDIQLTPETLAALIAAIAVIENIFGPFPSLSADDIRAIVKMGDRSLPFCLKTSDVLDQNQEILPSTFSLAGLHHDIAAYQLLLPIVMRLRELLAKGEDTLIALGSDILTTSLEGYTLMKLYGKSAGLDTLRQAMALRNGGPHRKAPVTKV